MANFDPLTAEISLGVSGTPANFNGFRVLASLLQRCRSMEANQTLHGVWPSSGLVHYIHFRGLLPLTEILPGAKFTLRPSLAFSYTGSVTARHGVVQGIELRNFRRGRHLYSAAGAAIVGHRPTFYLVMQVLKFIVPMAAAFSVGLYRLSMAVARSFSDDNAICYVLPVL